VCPGSAFPTIHGPGRVPCLAVGWVSGFWDYGAALLPASARWLLGEQDGWRWAVGAACDPLSAALPCREDVLASSSAPWWDCWGVCPAIACARPTRESGSASATFCKCKVRRSGASQPCSASSSLPSCPGITGVPWGQTLSPGGKGGNLLGWFCVPTLLALCLSSQLRKDPWERVIESNLPGARVRLGGQGHPSQLSESRALSPLLGTVPLHVCPPPRARRDRGWSDNLLS